MVSGYSKARPKQKEMYYILLKKRGNIDKAIISLILFLLGALPLLFWIIGQNLDKVARVGQKFPTEISTVVVILVGNFRPTLATLSQFCYPIRKEKKNSLHFH